MNKQDMLKVQTCVLRVNIHCEGCMHKVKKKLQKVEGVYKVSIDSEQGKVVVSGNADPANLIEKLEKAGKHAELWGPPQKGGAAQFPIHQQLNKFQIESLHKNQKKGGNEQQQQQQQMMKKNGFVQIPIKKGSNEEKLPPKDHKSVRFDLPHRHEEEEEDDDDDYEDYDDEDDDFDEYDDEEDGEFENEFEEVHSKPPPTKAAVKEKQMKAAANGHKGDKGGGEGGKAKKGGGGGIDMFIKGMLKKAGGGKKEKSKSDKSSKKKEDGGKNGGKKGEFEFADAKMGKNDGDGWSKKGEENFHGGKHQHEMKPNHKGGGGGKNMEMGQKGGFPAVAGMPAMNGGRFAGVGPGNPYSQQQQLMAQMMMMNQQRENGGGHEAYHPNLAYARPPPPAMSYGPAPGMGYGPPPPGMGYGPALPHMGYGPPPPHMGYGPPQHSAEYTHMFSDENTDSCSVM